MLLPIVIFICVVCGALGNWDDKMYFWLHPSNMTVKVNSTIILQCQIKPVKVMKVQWIKNGFRFSITKAALRYFSKHLGDVDKVTLINPFVKGYYDLKITKVNVNDEGIYFCQISIGSGNVLSWPATVKVIAHSEAPQLVQLGPDSGPMSQPPPIVLQSSLVPVQQRQQGQNTSVAAASIATINNGVSLVLQCSALAGRPGARLVWSMNGYPLRPVPASDSSQLPLFNPLTNKYGSRPTDACNRRERWLRFRGGPYNLIEGTIFETCRRNHTFSRLFDSYSILRPLFNHIFNGKVIRCTAVNRGYENFNLPPAEIQVEILIRPQVRMEVMPQRQTKEYIEYSWVTFVCTAKGRPNKFTWSWFVNETAVPEPPKSDTYKMQVTRSLHKAVIKCVARNHKEGHASTVINVKYPMPMNLIVGGTVFVTMAMLIIIIVICVCKRGLWGRKYPKGCKKAIRTTKAESFSISSN